jgi:hypothetical protein
MINHHYTKAWKNNQSKYFLEIAIVLSAVKW